MGNRHRSATAISRQRQTDRQTNCLITCCLSETPKHCQMLDIPASGQRSHVSDMHIPVPLQERVPLTKGCQCMVFVAQNVYTFRMSHK